MSITTKGGDKGQTSLYTGQRVWKDDLRVDAYGTLDELDALIGETKHHVGNPAIHDLLVRIQNKLYRMMSQLATVGRDSDIPICEQDVDELTEIIHSYEQRVQLTGFVIPGTTIPSAKLDICRTVARRAERRIVALAHAEQVPAEVIGFINRLSDLLFILARSIEAEQGVLTYVQKPASKCKE